ncbi:MAG TPA: pyruvate kinase, partial [Spirochaetota bacterium]|nr:pyruvate kinase [Spirochaetota bacterium]
MRSIREVSTGLNGFDKIINNLNLGDNVVWQVDNLEVYREFVAPYVEQAFMDGRKIHYIRFASHEPVLDPADSRINYHSLNAFSGFESFALSVHGIIAEAGR